MKALGLVTLITLASLACSAQPASQVVTIGVLFYNVPTRETVGPRPENPLSRALVEGLRDKGWVDGRNARIVWRTAAEHPDGVKGTVHELLRIPVDILVASGNDFAVESRNRAPHIPVVLASSDFPVENGLVASLSRPGGNITGLSNWVGRNLNAKRLALLKESAPRSKRIAVMWNSIPAGTEPFGGAIKAAAERLGVSLVHVPVDEMSQLEAALGSAVKAGADALFVIDYPFAFKKDSQVRLAQLAIQYRLPALHSASTAADHGALITYAPDIAQNYRRAAALVDKILRGAKAGDIPFEEPSRLELIVNLEAAKAIGLALPPSILTQASRVIQ
jgi:putative ABC transport system substrate-binding protein